MSRRPNKNSQSWNRGETVTPMSHRDPWNPYLVQNRPMSIDEVRDLL